MSAPDTLELWLPHVGSSFTAGGDAGLCLELVEASPLKPNGLPGRPPFSLVFEGDRDRGVLPQQIHELTHPELGRRAIFIVPIGATATRVRYEAVFS